MDKEKPLDEQEQEFLGRLKAGTPGAFKVLVELYQDTVLNTCYRFTFNREDAEDLAQETFIEIYRSIAAFRGEAKLSTWIYRIAVSKSIDFIRKKKRKKRLTKLKSLAGLEEEGKDLAAPPEGDPAKSLEREERMRILREVIQHLPEKQRIAFTLSKTKGFGNKEISGIMNTTLSSVEALIHRAKTNLKIKLYHYFERDLRKKEKIRRFFIFLTSQLIGIVLYLLFFIL